MRVLVVGSGGREHALAWAIAASTLVDTLYCAPGNAGIAEEAECVPIRATDIAGLVGFCRRERIDFVVVGPEAPLVLGLVDALEAAGVPAFGPSAAAAALEASKASTKDMCAPPQTPTASYRRFRDPSAAKAFIKGRGAPIIIKADCLAAGQGVAVADDLDIAYRAVDEALVERRFGSAGIEIVVEDFLAGEEVSFFALVDGRDALPLATAQYYKRVGDGDTGPNTGGMGAYSPSPRFNPTLEGCVMERIILPAITAMQREGRVFKGVLYAGLMLTEAGPMLLEFNTRFGDPECQVLMMRLMSDLLPALIAARDGVLKSVDLRWHADTALCVVMAGKGYPDAAQRGSEIRGLDAGSSDAKVKIFHAGTRREDQRLIADRGPRRTARERAYPAVDRIEWPAGFCRRDIGRRALQV